jgi:hypothetical protein
MKALQPKHRYSDFIRDFHAGKNGAVFVDDSGSPGLAYTSDTYRENYKSWVAVIVSRDQISEVYKQLPCAIDGLREFVPRAREFHFTDIYGARKEFKGIDANVRLAIFRFMAFVFCEHKFPIIVQTLSPDFLSRFPIILEFPKKLGPLQMNRHGDAALMVLLMRIRHKLLTVFRDEAPVRIFVDEGILKNGQGFVIPPLSNVFCDGAVLFASSKTVLPIQLADFAAFTLNRWKILTGKSDLNEFDKEFIRIVTPVAELYSDLEQVSVIDYPNLRNIKLGLN